MMNETQVLLENRDMAYLDRQQQETLKEQIPSRPTKPMDGAISHYKSFPSQWIRPRQVDVWLPEGYDPNSSHRYPVVYMHDGQLSFHIAASPFAGMDLFWEVDKAMTRLASA